MRGNVARRWKVSDLASEVGMSRTSFAERFKILVGAYGAARLRAHRRRLTAELKSLPGPYDASKMTAQLACAA
jgi:AraC-like DNA-binding protein